MTSVVSICNQALGWLGQDAIISLDDDTKAAGLCKVNYAPLRDAVLEASNWTFATRRYDLPALATGPLFEYANAYRIPSEVLRIIDVNKQDLYDETRNWQVEGEDIVTNDNRCQIKAIVRIEDTSFFSPLFVQALAQRLAADLAIPLTHSRTLQEQHWGLYERKLGEAANRDGLQGKSRRARSRWLERARLSSGPRSAGPTV